MTNQPPFSLDLFFSYSFDLLAIVGPDGYFKRVNPAFEKTMGYSQEELCARPLFEFLHPDDVDKTIKGIQLLSSGRSTISSKNRYRCKDGTYKWFAWNTNPVDSLFYTVGRDITEQIRSEEEIRHLNEELGKKNDALEIKIQDRIQELQRSESQVQQLQKMDAVGRLAGGIAHDFNNMLGAISLYCGLLADGLDPEGMPEHFENVQNIQKTADRAAALTRQLLIFSRKQITQFQTVHLNSLIQQLEKMLKRLIGENIQIILKLSQDLRTVSVDPTQIEQVLLNLVVNARDAMPKGGSITIESRNVYLDEVFTSTHLSVTRGHYVLLSVTDTGTGMDAETQSKIFEPFFTTKPMGQGTGMGLTTTYGIIKQSRGTIWVYSELGRGTTFKIYLPITGKPVETAETAPLKISDVVGIQTLLVVEDDERLRQGFTKVLRKKGYQVFDAKDAASALDFCQRHKERIDLMLTDIIMPGDNGLELAQKVLALRTDLRVLYMSGYTNDALENSGRESIPDFEFIQKPFSPNALIAKVQEVLGSARPRPSKDER